MTNEDATLYQSLGDIRLRKAQLQTLLAKDSARARKIIDDMRHPKKAATSKKLGLSGIVSTGMGVVDGALFAWKLYRKFGGGGGKKFFRF